MADRVARVFAGRLALITGAGSGIGRALAVELSRLGAAVVATDIDGEAAEMTAQLARGGAGRVSAARLDVTDADAVANLIGETDEGGPGLDFLFNNAGIAIGGEAQHLSLADWQRVIDVNLRGVLHGVHAAYPRMVQRGRGHIINVASIAGLSPFPLVAPYTATKHAVVGLSQSLRAEGAALGVRVSVVCPGAIDTAIWTRSELRGLELDLADPRSQRMTAADCARVILRGVAHNRAVIVVTREARALWILQRLSPALSRLAHRRLVSRVRRLAHGPAAASPDSTNS